MPSAAGRPPVGPSSAAEPGMEKIPWGIVVIGGLFVLGGTLMALFDDESRVQSAGILTFGVWMVCVWLAFDVRSRLSPKGRATAIAISAVASIAFGAVFALYPGSISKPTDSEPLLRACGIGAIILFGVGGLYLARRMAQDASALDARIEGLVVGSEILPWSAIKDVHVVRAGPSRWLHVALHEPVEGFRSVRVRSWVNRGMKSSDEDLSIPIPFRADPDELMRSIQRYVPPQPARPAP